MSEANISNDRPTAVVKPSEFDLSTPLLAATSYCRAGWSPIPIPFRSKQAFLDKWQHLRLRPDDVGNHFTGGPQNIGVILGEASGGLVDVDLDCPEAIRLAAHFLPPTACTFGRASAPESHRLYLADTLSVASCTREDVASKSADDTKSMIVELRGDRHQTVFPGSTHKGGERIEFVKLGPPTPISHDLLKASVSKLAAAVLLLRHWPGKGSRHAAALELAGALLRHGWSQADAADFIRVVATAAGDDEVDDRVRAVESTRARLEEGKPARGLPALRKLLGNEVVEKLVDWLGLKCKPSMSPQPPEREYFVNELGTWWIKATREGPIPVRLANFVAEIGADTLEDDGVEAVHRFDVSCTIAGGEVGAVTVGAEEFSAMTWPIRSLGARAIIEPGSTMAQRLRVAIQSMSDSMIQRTVYTHTGWRQVEGGYVYLHGDGAIGKDGVVDSLETHLEGTLARYRLPAPPNGEDLHVAATALLGLLKLGPGRIMFPLIASVARAVLGNTDFSIFLEGHTGTFKSETASLIQRCFGQEFDAKHLPGSWTSTGNALEESAFRVKDAIFVVDDFKPAGDGGDVQLQQQADRLLRAQGNGAARQRMRADLTLRAARPPRGLIVCTGEELPTGESLRARIVTVPVREGDIDLATLTRCQAEANNGVYASATAAFIRWCARQLDALREELRTKAANSRSTYAGGHARTACAMSELEVSFAILVRFVAEATAEVALTHAEAKEQIALCRAALLELVEGQQAEIQAADPVSRFFELTASSLASGRAHIASKSGTAPDDPQAWGWRTDGPGGMQPKGERIGWVDGGDLYLDPTASFRVARAAASGSEGVCIQERTLRKRIAERGLLLSREEGRQTFTHRVLLDGRRRGVLHLHVDVLEAGRAQDHAKGGEP